MERAQIGRARMGNSDFYAQECIRRVVADAILSFFVLQMRKECGILHLR